MINSLTKALFSTRLMAVLFVVFATAMALGTFVESWYSIQTARIWIYNAWWFEGIMLFFVINFMGNIKRYQLWKREKWAVLLLHLSWILIIAGAFVTRYISYEGVMPIREGQEANFFLSEKTYVTAFVDGEFEGEPLRKSLQDVVLFSKEANNKLDWNEDFKGKPFRIQYAGFIEGAEETLVEDTTGATYLKVVESSGGERHDHFIKEGEVTSIHNVLFALNHPTQGAINISTKDSAYTIETPFEGTFLRMADQLQGEVFKDTVQVLQLRSLYSVAGMQFVFPDPVIKGSYGIKEMKAEDKFKGNPNAIFLDITVADQTQRVGLLGGQYIINDPKKVNVGGFDFHLSYGSIRHELPFTIQLNDFVAERYPGTEKSYSSYMSKVTVKDEQSFDYDIYMNHILDHRGYRFFQASFDPDEKGTVLSVNHDYWGTWITYIGYFLLYTGLMGIMFYGKTRFRSLGEKLNEIKAKKATLTTLLVLGLLLPSMAQEHADTTHGLMPTKQQIDSVLKATKVDKAHAEKFGALVIQDDGGRMKPINTFASELLRKMSKSDVFMGMDANQALLSMMLNPAAWYHAEFMYLKKDNDSLHNLLGIEKGAKYVKAIDFFTPTGDYKLAPYLQDAYATNTPNQFQKDFKTSDQRLGLLNRALQGEIFKIFPIPDHDNNKWISTMDYRADNTLIRDTLYANFVNNSIPFYIMTLRNALKTGDYSESDKILEAFNKNQHNYGTAVMPSDSKIKAEILYNKYDIFKNLFSWYMYVGTLLFVVLLIQIFKDSKGIRLTAKILGYAIFALFALHTAGLIARWYVSGHAPWSDAYESMIYVAWATMGMGVLFAKKSPLTLASTAFVTSMVLMIAHWSWMDLAIANLQPVLDSYWLMIHVAVIVGSYGPFTLGLIIGAVVLLLMLFTTNENKPKMTLAIKELTIVNELALTVGLVMLTIGNFLGGQWANESWGRYWGWDPKETWALVSIMVYAFVVHMRIVPGLRGTWAFNFASVVAFASIMMTYFGVNFYLSGLHSYASGEKIITPSFVYYSVVIVAILGALSYWRYKVHYKKK